jgi:Ca2+-binding EF-hand superfamily protein
MENNMNTRTRRLALTIGFISAFSLNAAAAPDMMAKLDLNSDTYIDKTEFLSGANQRFADMDTDSNGVVTKDEREAFQARKREEHAQKRFERSDANSDGAISQQEFNTARAERNQKREAIRAERQEKRQARGERSGERHKRTRFQPDATGDGVVDVAEHNAAAEHKFTKMDKDGDGVLSQGEIESGKHHGRKMRHGPRKDGMGR